VTRVRQDGLPRDLQVAQDVAHGRRQTVRAIGGPWPGPAMHNGV
jgi:hypothetical protein